MKFISSLFFVCSTIVTWSAQAETINGAECYQCSSAEMQSVANSWAMRNINNTSVGVVNAKTVNVADLYNKKISTYKVWLESTPLPPPRPPVAAPRSTLVETSAVVQRYMEDVKSSISFLKAEAQSTTIKVGDGTGLTGPWSFVNCAYCKTQVNDQLNSTMYASMRSAEATVLTIAKAFGLIKTDLPDQFIIPFSSGNGYVKVSLKLLSQPAKIEATIEEVVDENGNSVPPSAKGLDRLRIMIQSVGSARAINVEINQLNYFVPIQTGTVTITDCSGINAPACGSN
ncbi:hypothetical protein [Pseudoalteromonas sp. TAB23]|uniref:hypothetical protein n=1 Tax=Pseudoalteromonas sp. TAB23 TaxID=1938595 RepID=UPI00041101F9|nr:hypothetical protein [Pseudoalteromonas sp. TAB23]